MVSCSLIVLYTQCLIAGEIKTIGGGHPCPMETFSSLYFCLFLHPLRFCTHRIRFGIHKSPFQYPESVSVSTKSPFRSVSVNRDTAWHGKLGIQKIYVNDNPGLTLTYFTARSI